MEQFDDINLRQLTDLLLRKIGLIIAITLLAGILAFVYSEIMISPEYESSVTMYVNNESESTMQKTLGSDIQASQMLVDTYIVIIKSDTVLNEVSKKLTEKELYGYTAEGLRNGITANAVDATEIFEVKVKSEDPKHAYIIANVIADVAPDIIKDFVEASSVKIIDYALIGEKVSPNVQRNMILGLLIGFFLSCLFVILREIFDTRIKTEDELEQWFKLPILGVVPDIADSQVKKTGGYYSYKRGTGAYEYSRKGADKNAGKSS